MHGAPGFAHKARMSTRARPSIAPTVGAFLVLAVVVFAVIYYGAVPWALSRVIGATFWLLGWR